MSRLFPVILESKENPFMLAEDSTPLSLEMTKGKVISRPIESEVG